MQRRRRPPDLRLVPLPRRAAPRPGVQALRLAARVRELRDSLSRETVPPPVVPLRPRVRVSGDQRLIFLELRNLSGRALRELGVEVVALDGAGREVGAMYAVLSELGVSADPTRVVRVGGWPAGAQGQAVSALITLLFARFRDGTSWEGELEALEDPRLPPTERARQAAAFMRSYQPFMRAAELNEADPTHAN